MHELTLNGCRPEPMISYLKSLGVLRLVSQQKDSAIRAAWRGDAFTLRSELDEDGLLTFFLDEFAPTPIVAPWAGGSGFFGKDNKEPRELIAGSISTRFASYRSVIQRVNDILTTEGQKEKPTEDDKSRLIRLYRRELPDDFVQWIDAVLVLQDDGQKFPPLLGTGGNDGRLDFTQNFMQRLTELGLHEGAGKEKSPKKTMSRDWLESALFGTLSSHLPSKAVGQFHPGGIGGPNATQGMEGNSKVNPWDFVLMMEGAVSMAGAVARRLGSQQAAKTAFPFTVGASQVGQASLDRTDLPDSRGEIWLPLWNHFATYSELSLMFAEGRAELSGRQCRNGLEFARCIAGLGVDRGLSGFVRYGFMKRSGKAFLASPLGRFEVLSKPDVDLLRELETFEWLGRFRRACENQNPSPPQRFTTALRKLDSAVLDYCRYGGNIRFQFILRALGLIERELALLGDTKVANHDINPVPVLSSRWIQACNDGTPEFRLAVALASIRRSGSGDTKVGPLRSNLEPTELVGRRHSWAEKGRAVVWSGGDLCRNLAAILQRRLVDWRRLGLDHLPLESTYAVEPEDVALFLDGKTDDKRLADLLWGCVLIERGTMSNYVEEEVTRSISIPWSYALLKLLLLPQAFALKSGSSEVPVRPNAAIITHLRSGQPRRALQMAARTLRAAGFIPMPGQHSAGARRELEGSTSLNPLRLAAALLIPVRRTQRLRELVLRSTKESRS